MANKQFDYEERGGANGSQIKYPDDVFSDGVLTVDGSLLWRGATRYNKIVVGEYSGALDLTDYIDPNPSIDVVILSITGDGYIGGDTSLFYAKAKVPISIEAIVDKPDGTQLVLPMKRNSSAAEVEYKFGQVLDGKVVFSLSFSKSGRWECTERLINTMASGDDVFSFAGVVAIVDMAS